MKRLFGNAIGKVSMSSTKSAIGHLLGGAGAVETIFCILAIRDQIVPPTLNLDNPDEGTEGVDLVPHVAKQREVKAVLNNSFGFGGTNASLVMKAVSVRPSCDAVFVTKRLLLILVPGVAILAAFLAIWLFWAGPGPASEPKTLIVAARIEHDPRRRPARAGRPDPRRAARSACSRAFWAPATRSRPASSSSRPAPAPPPSSTCSSTRRPVAAAGDDPRRHALGARPRAADAQSLPHRRDPGAGGGERAAQ